MRRSRKAPWLITGVLLAALCVVGVLFFLIWEGPTVTIDDSLRQRLAGRAKIVAVAEELSDKGTSVHEYEYVVIRPGAGNDERAIDGQAAHIRSLGWKDGLPAHGHGPSLLSAENETAVQLESLESFLKGRSTGNDLSSEDRAALRIQSMITDPTGMMVMVLRPYE